MDNYLLLALSHFFFNLCSMMLTQKSQNKDFRNRAKGFENKLTYEEMRRLGKQLQQECEGGLSYSEQQERESAASFYRTQ